MGLTINEGKRVRRKLVCTAWGAQLEGDAGWVGPPRFKLVHLMYLTALVAIGGVCNGDIVGTLTGVWAFALSFRPSLFSLMLCIGVEHGVLVLRVVCCVWVLMLVLVLVLKNVLGAPKLKTYQLTMNT